MHVLQSNKHTHTHKEHVKNITLKKYISIEKCVLQSCCICFFFPINKLFRFSLSWNLKKTNKKYYSHIFHPISTLKTKNWTYHTKVTIKWIKLFESSQRLLVWTFFLPHFYRYCTLKNKKNTKFYFSYSFHVPLCIFFFFFAKQINMYANF